MQTRFLSSSFDNACGQAGRRRKHELFLHTYFQACFEGCPRCCSDSKPREKEKNTKHNYFCTPACRRTLRAARDAARREEQARKEAAQQRAAAALEAAAVRVLALVCVEIIFVAINIELCFCSELLGRIQCSSFCVQSGRQP